MCLKSLFFNPLLSILVASLLCAAIVSSSCLNCTENRFKFSEILSRKRRYLIFPTGSTILCTLSVVKALMFARPTGHNMVVEVDFYYPLPDKVIHPMRKNPQPIEAAAVQKPTVAPAVEVAEFHHHDDYLHNLQSYHDDVVTSQRKSDKGVFLSKSHYPASHREKVFMHQNYITPVPRGKEKWYKVRGKRSDETLMDSKGEIEDHKGHRDRRDLYRSIEKFINDQGFGLSGRYCVLRTICEAQHWLMPKGASLFHDIIRVLFSLPSESNYVDSYKRAMSGEENEETNCQMYEKKCPISILSFILYSEKIV